MEISEDGIRDFKGSYEEYVHYCGDDHLDVDTVVLKARREKRAARAAAAETHDAGKLSARGNARGGDAGIARGSRNRYRGGSLRKKLNDTTKRIEATETRLAEIDRIFADPAFYAETPSEEVRTLETERVARQGGTQRTHEGLGEDRDRTRPPSVDARRPVAAAARAGGTLIRRLQAPRTRLRPCGARPDAVSELRLHAQSTDQ